MASIHKLLDKKEWDVIEMKSLLEHDSSSINKFDTSQLRLTPLQRVIKDEKATVAIIKLFVSFGANPNLVSRNSEKPLLTSILCKRDAEIVRSLLDGGAQVDIRDREGHSLLCLIIRDDPPLELVQVLMEGGASVNNCNLHVSPIYCAMRLSPDFKIKADVCKMIIEADTGIVLQPLKGRSFLCHILRRISYPGVIKVIIDAGGALNPCKKENHFSPFYCATADPGPLTAIAVQDLLEAGVTTAITDNISPLFLALEKRNCETGAIRLMYDHFGGDNFYLNDYLIHSAVKNSHCKTSVIRFLIEKGADAGAPHGGKYGRTPLHYAMQNANIKPAVVQLLLDKGCPVDSEWNEFYCTALWLAVVFDKCHEIMEMLLKAGSRLVTVDFYHKIYRRPLEKYELNRSVENHNYLKMFLKYTYLEDPQFSLQDVPRCRKVHSKFTAFENECKQEIEVMKSNNIFKFVGRYSEDQPKATSEEQLLLLRAPTVSNYPIYYDVIASTFGRKAVEARLQEQPVCFNIKTSSNSPWKLILNYDIISEITSFLSLEDKFSLLVALNNPSKPADGAKETQRKRNNKEPSGSRKRIRNSR